MYDTWINFVTSGTWDHYKCRYNPFSVNQTSYLGYACCHTMLTPSMHTCEMQLPVLGTMFQLLHITAHTDDCFMHCYLFFLLHVAKKSRRIPTQPNFWQNNVETVFVLCRQNTEMVNEISPLHFRKIQNIFCICTLTTKLQPPFDKIMDWSSNRHTVWQTEFTLNKYRHEDMKTFTKFSNYGDFCNISCTIYIFFLLLNILPS